MAKRSAKVLDETDEILPTKKRKIYIQKEEDENDNELHLDRLIKQCIDDKRSEFVEKYTSNNLSLIITDYISFNNNNCNDGKMIYLSIQNKWKHINKLKKSEKIEYLKQEIINPLQYLLKQFNLKDINKSIHYEYFLNGKSTSKTKWSKHNKFWISTNISKPIKPNYWSSNQHIFIQRSFNSICHFIQKESGTGVHIGNGYILSCAHVIVSDHDDDDDDDDDIDQIIDRIGRIKYVIFANGLIYKTKCIAVNEKDDLSLLQINFESVIDIMQSKSIDGNNDNDMELRKMEIGSAILSENEPELKCDLFCIGNPSNINLESNIDDEYNDFYPKIFHLSFGRLEMENKTDDDLGGYGHSCFTYWGHSGAPIFNTNGDIVGLHNSWNDQTGLRHAITLNNIKRFIQNICK